MTTLIHTFAGNIGIGTDDPGSYSLSVNGSTRADSLTVNGVTDAEVKIGLISMWYGTVADIPSGWTICDGVEVVRSDGGGNITPPNLQTRFIIGADGDAPSPAVPGQTGGINVHGITEGQLPSHSHTITPDTANAPHPHSLAANNMPHSHNTGNGSRNHNHGIQGNNMLHYHGYVHAGIQNGMADNFVWGGTNKCAKNLQGHNTNGANAPHAHNTGNGNNHNHNINTNNAPHSHTAPAVNTPHTHTANSANAGGTDQITVTNPFYVLAFIMKH
jgi:hypothetical protein